MRLLLDTHAFLWFVLNDPQLSSNVLTLMTDPNNELLLSPASYWELAIKVNLKKYALPRDFADFYYGGTGNSQQHHDPADHHSTRRSSGRVAVPPP